MSEDCRGWVSGRFTIPVLPGCLCTKGLNRLSCSKLLVVPQRWQAPRGQQGRDVLQVLCVALAPEETVIRT